MHLVNDVSGILFSEALAAEYTIVFAKACELGLEGIGSKRAASTRAGQAETTKSIAAHRCERRPNLRVLANDAGKIDLLHSSDPSKPRIDPS